MNEEQIDMAFLPMITIGNNVTIAETKILAHDASAEKFIGSTKVGEVTVGDNVFIGAGSILLPDTTIEKNTVIGAGTVVRGKVPDNSVTLGNPCRVVCSLDEYLEKRINRVSSH